MSKVGGLFNPFESELHQQSGVDSPDVALVAPGIFD